MSTNEHHVRIGETEYAALDPRYVHPGRFGDFYSHPDFPDRFDANQLCRVRCRPGEVEAMLAELDALYEPTGLEYRKVSGYDADVWSDLGPGLSDLGWSLWKTRLLVLRSAPRLEANPDVQVAVVPPESQDLEALYQSDDGLDRGFELARSQASRVGGEYLVAYLDGKPAGCTGWFSRYGVARFRHVLTAPECRSRGVATTLILHVQRHPTVMACDTLAIMVNEDGPDSLYERLGFRDVMEFWEAKGPAG